MARSGLPDFDGRPTVRIVNTMPEHPKVVGLSDKAFRLYIEAICYCSRQESDGHVTDVMMRRMGVPKMIKELVDAGLLNKAAGGYEVHDYLKHQRSADEIKSYRESRSDAGALGAHKRWHVPNRKLVKDCPHCLEVLDGHG